MKNILVVLCVLSLACFLVDAAYSAGDGEQEGTGRYAIYVIEIEKVPTPFLLDTETGKVWMYSEDKGASSGEKYKFKGITVEGVAYGSKDLKSLDQQIDRWHTNNYVNKNLKGFNEMALSEFSYSLDFNKGQQINNGATVIDKSQKTSE